MSFQHINFLASRTHVHAWLMAPLLDTQLASNALVKEIS